MMYWQKALAVLLVIIAGCRAEAAGGQSPPIEPHLTSMPASGAVVMDARVAAQVATGSGTNGNASQSSMPSSASIC